MENKEVVSVLKGLITAMEDGTEGYKLSAEATDNDDMRTLFAHYAAQREQFATELRHMSSSYGQGAEEGEVEHLAEAVHRGWAHLQNTLHDKDLYSLLANCEHGEEHALNAYKKALELNLPTDVEHAVGAQILEIKAAHDKLKYLRDLAEAA